MKVIAKKLFLANNFKPAYYNCLCINSSVEDMNKMANQYGVERDMYIKVNGLEFKVIAIISEKANTVDGEELNVDDLAWCDPKALMSSFKDYFPISKYLYDFNMPAWIMSKVFVKRMVQIYQ